MKAGQILGFMGDSDPLPLDVRADVPTDRTIQLAPDAIAPHIRLTIAELDGTPLDAYGPVIDALFRQACSVAIGPWIVPPNGSGHDVVTIETTDTDHDIDSQWVITSTGQVTAAGWAAMIYPERGLHIRATRRARSGGRGNRRRRTRLDRPDRSARRRSGCNSPFATSRPVASRCAQSRSGAAC